LSIAEIIVAQPEPAATRSWFTVLSAVTSSAVASDGGAAHGVVDGVPPVLCPPVPLGAPPLDVTPPAETPPEDVPPDEAPPDGVPPDDVAPDAPSAPPLDGPPPDVPPGSPPDPGEPPDGAAPVPSCAELPLEFELHAKVPATTHDAQIIAARIFAVATMKMSLARFGVLSSVFAADFRLP
jgi:hypothetical protein